QLVGVGAAGEWSRQMLTSSADHMDLISEHLYWQDRDDVLEHIAQIRAQINRVAEAHRSYRSEIPGLADKDIRIAMDEWNYWYGGYEYGELGVQYFLQDALGIAAGLHTFFRNSDLYYMANYAQTVNVIGAIKTTKTDAELETTGLVLQLYRSHFGTHPVQVSLDDASLDVSAAMSDDNTMLTVAVINPLEESRELDLSIVGHALNGKGSRWTITGDSRWSHNTPGEPREVDIYQTSFTNASNRITVAPLSVTLFAFGVQ
ncbi:MAG: alpha-N-arabinofuranosidase, partial [Gemmatimonadota bacterium]